MGFLNPKELRKKRFSFRKNRKSKDPPGEGVPKKSISLELDTPKTVAEEESPSDSSGSVSSQEHQSTNSSATEEGSADFVNTPIKNLLGDLNVVEDDDEDAMELVLGAIPPKQQDPDELIDNMGPVDPDTGAPDDEEDDEHGEDDDEEEEAAEKSDAQKKRNYSGPVDLDDESFPDDETMSTLSRDPAGKVAKPAKKEDPPDLVEDEDHDASVPQKTARSAPDAPEERAFAMEDPEEDEANWDAPDGAARKLLGVFNCAEDTACVPESLLDTTCDDACGPIGGKPEKRGLKRNLSYYNDQFAVKFLDEILNVGYALIHHVPAGDGDWSGRSATLILRPGTCNATEMVPPTLEWTTMGGGTQTNIDTKTISLLDIHSITSSNLEVEDEANGEDDDDIAENEELQCLFTVTTTDGVVEVFEAITPNETARLVNGIKNLAARFSNQLIAGDVRAFTDFYSQHGEDDRNKLTVQEAMVRMSHSFLDA